LTYGSISHILTTQDDKEENKMKNTKTAYENLIESEGNTLANIAKLLSGDIKQARETLERIVDQALEKLYEKE
jgi:hypothetical protein